MNFCSVRLVRLFLSEKGGEAESLLGKLRAEWKVHGVIIYRGAAGFGNSGRMPSTRILEVSHDLPMTMRIA